MNETKQLAQFVHQTSYADIPSAIIDEFKIFVLDTIAAGFIGSLQPWTQEVDRRGASRSAASRRLRCSTRTGRSTSPARR